MGLPIHGWKNKNGTSERNCRCGSWKNHWCNFSNKEWPTICSANDCLNKPTVGAHVFNEAVSGERIVPFCDSCNKRVGEITLRGGVTVVLANVKNTCEK